MSAIADLIYAQLSLNWRLFCLYAAPGAVMAVTRRSDVKEWIVRSLM